MGGILVIRDEPETATWLPQSWVFDTVLSRVSEMIDDDELARRLRAAEVEEYSGYCRIDDLERSRFATFVSAAEGAHARVEERGPEALTEPGAFRSYVASLAELLALLRTDPRDMRDRGEGTIIADDGRTWTAPFWLFDFVTAHLAAWTRADQPLLAAALRRGHTIDMHGRTALLREGLLWMTQRYGEGIGLGGQAPSVYARIAEGVNESANILQR